MTNVIPFPAPSRSTSRFRVRAVRSTRVRDMFELQSFEGGAWRAKSLFASKAEADSAVADLIISRFIADGGDAA